MAPPTPTTTPMTVFLVLVLIPDLEVLSWLSVAAEDDFELPDEVAVLEGVVVYEVALPLTVVTTVTSSTALDDDAAAVGAVVVVRAFLSVVLDWAAAVVVDAEVGVVEVVSLSWVVVDDAAAEGVVEVAVVFGDVVVVAAEAESDVVVLDDFEVVVAGAEVEVDVVLAAAVPNRTEPTADNGLSSNPLATSFSSCAARRFKLQAFETWERARQTASRRNGCGDENIMIIV